MPILRLSTALTLLCLLFACSNKPHADGIIWQPDNALTQPQGQWQTLGVKHLLVQWSVVDGLSFVETCGNRIPKHPDWNAIANAPWATEIILGLAGRYNETDARNNLDVLFAQSKCIATAPLPFTVKGWYFPVEIDPTWTDAPQLVPYLNQLPRPLWISVYDNSNIGPQALANWLAHWLPDDVGVFFQDGVGLYMREPKVAADYMATLQNTLGKQRVRLIAEAFRPDAKGGFRAANPTELRVQLDHYTPYTTYLFESRYVTDDVMKALKR